MPPKPAHLAALAVLLTLAALALAPGCSVGAVIFAEPPPDGGCGDAGCAPCRTAGDCASPSEEICQGNLCISMCADGVKDGNETDVDCGGDACPPCPDGRHCFLDHDCRSGECDGDMCVSECLDGVKDGSETGVDCGGGACPPCGDGVGCVVGTDCSSNLCVSGLCASCTDGVQDGDETDTDCGGPDCPKCGKGDTCLHDGDCQSGVCDGGACT